MELEYGAEELAYLSKKSPVLAKLIAHYGKIPTILDEDLYASLISSFVGQALSASAARTIGKRVASLAGAVTPESMESLSTEKLRKCGLSLAKIAYIRGLDKALKEGSLNLPELAALSDSDLLKKLTSIKGIGLWTAEMTAVFALGRKDIFSFGDAALRGGMTSAHGFATLSKQRFLRFKKLYAPYGSVASLYYYAYNDDPAKDWLER
jgi:3-methyladenine DNA glycosylase/8-oxoguanine DNA glycosylase